MFDISSSFIFWFFRLLYMSTMLYSNSLFIIMSLLRGENSTTPNFDQSKASIIAFA